jgi:outer membrane protein
MLVAVAWEARIWPRRFARTLGTTCLLSSLALAGCEHLARPSPWKIAQDPVPTEDNSVRLLFAAAEPAPTDSWERGADEPPNTLHLSLADAIEIALQGNPRLRKARAGIEKARGGEQVAFAPFLPEVGLTNRIGTVSGNLSPGPPGPAGGIVGLGDSMHDFIQTELQVQWMIYDFGRTSGRYRQALTRERIAELLYTRARETVAFDAAAGLLQGLLTAALKTVQEEAIRAADSTLKDSRVRRAAGVADRDDVLRAEVQASEVREAWILAREAELAALARLNNVLGRNAALPLKLVDPKSEPPLTNTLSQSLEIAARQRPEVAIAQEAVAAARFGRDAAAADFKPKIYVRGSVGYVDGRNILDGYQEGVALHLDQPLYRGGQRLGELRSADAEIAEATASAQALLDQISLEVTLAFRSAGAARARIQLARPAVAEAEENLRLVRTRYRNGNATPTDIADAESTSTRARQRFQVATYDYLIALARLDYAIGNPPALSLGSAP